MAIVIIVHPFPAWVETSGTLMLAGALLLLAVLIALQTARNPHRRAGSLPDEPLPAAIRGRIESLTGPFSRRHFPLKSAGHYAAAAILSIAIWLCYAGMNSPAWKPSAWSHPIDCPGMSAWWCSCSPP